MNSKAKKLRMNSCELLKEYLDIRLIKVIILI